MVKIRFPRGTNMIQHSVIQIAIDKTSMKFDNNIEANRFDQVGNHYEVTIKCKSSRGKGAKRGASGRRTTNCCWHAWGAFFDELFNLNSDIVIIAQCNIITKDSGNWVDREVGQGIRESTMCDCEANGWVRDVEAHGVVARGWETPDYEVLEPQTEPTHHECNHTCRHNSSNNNGILCARSCDGSWNPGWEPVVEAPSQTCARRCRTCRHSRLNNATQALCCVGGCTYPAFQKWELYIPTINVLDETYYDHGGRFYSKPTVGLMETEPLRFKVPEEE